MIDILYIIFKVYGKIYGIKNNYTEYSATPPVNITMELKRLSEIEQDTCCTIAIMILSEDYQCDGVFE